jgi:HEAT repeat protein
VRKAALVSLAVVGGPEAVSAAQARLTDRVGLVRAHAARALGALGACETAWRVAPLLGDREWWVRLAARHVLESFGKEAAWALIPLLSSDDPFLRDGAEAVMNQLASGSPDVTATATDWNEAVRRAFLPARAVGEALA